MGGKMKKKLNKNTLCVICALEVDKKKDNYFKVDLFLHGKLHGTDYAHQTCWLQRNQVNANVNNILNGLGGMLNSLGIEPPKKKVIIQ